MCWGNNDQGQVMLFCCCVGISMCLGGDVSQADGVFFVQLGDGTTTQRSTPVYAGLSSNIQMISLGYVRIVVIAEWLLSNHGVFI